MNCQRICFWQKMDTQQERVIVRMETLNEIPRAQGYCAMELAGHRRARLEGR